MQKNSSEKFLAILITLVVSLIILEIGLRNTGRNPTNMAAGINEQWHDCFRLKKNIYKSINWPAFSYKIYTNDFGFRDKQIGKVDIKDTPYYVFLGASEVFANGVDYEKSFVGILDEKLSTKGFKVLNMAVGGHRFPDQEALFKEFLLNAPHKPSKCFFCVNALHIPKFDMPRKNIRVKNGYTFNRDSWKKAYLRMVLGNYSASYSFFRNGFRKIQEEWFDYKHVSKSPEFFEIFSKKNRMYDPEVIKQFETYLYNFEIFCNDNDIKLIFVFLPIINSYSLNELLIQYDQHPEEYDTTYYTTLMENYCKKYDSKFINLRPLLQDYYEKGLELRFKLDPHYNEFANKIIGEYFIETLFPEDAENYSN